MGDQAWVTTRFERQLRGWFRIVFRGLVLGCFVGCVRARRTRVRYNRRSLPVQTTPDLMSDTTTHYRGRFLSLLERNGWEFASRSNATGVAVLVAVTDAGEILLVEQYRKPLARRVIELPAGLVGDQSDPDESLLQAAGRELEEETGYAADLLKVLMACPSSAGMTDEIITFVLATGLRRVGPGGGDPSEDIELLPVPLAEVDGWLAQRLEAGAALDPKIYAALYWLQQTGHHARS
jgi:ADP-ribose pyrophosphatase